MAGPGGKTVTPDRRETMASPATPPAALPETLPMVAVPGSTDASQPSLAFIGTPPEAAYQQFASYELIAEVARGGMGIVYKALDRDLNRIVALKTLRFRQLSTAEEVQRFLFEARAVAQLTHPNIVPIYEVGEFGGEHYFTMAFAPGGSLASRVGEFKDNPRGAVALMETVCRAVHYGHTKGVLHRDLKPSNILLGERGEPLVTDFGIAKFLNAEVESGLTVTGELLGTPQYMAPEQAAGETDKVTPVTDVWSLGVMLYELLTGRRPFPEKRREQLLASIRVSEPTHPRSLLRSIDRDLETIILKSLEKDPSDRYASAEALADDLRNWLAGEAISARRQPLPVRAWRKARRYPAISTALTILGVAAIVAAIVLHYYDPDLPLAAIQRRLAEGKPVTLLGPTGEPSWAKVVVGDTQAQFGQADANKSFSFSSWGYSLLELLPDPHCERYRFRAELLHHRNSKGHVGIYFMRGQERDVSGWKHSFWVWSFNDHEVFAMFPKRQDEKVSDVRLSIRGVRQRPDPGDDSFSSVQGILRKHYVPARFKGEDPETEWRQLMVDVRPESITMFWNGEEVGVLTREQLDRYAQRLAKLQPGPIGNVPESTPRQGLGLVAFQGNVFARNVTIEPLSP